MQGPEMRAGGKNIVNDTTAVSVIRRPPFGMRLGSVRCPPGIWWTPDDDDAGGIERKWGWRRRSGRAGEAAVAERGGTAADRGRGSGAGRFGCGRGSGERRQREPGLQMDPSIAGRLARSSQRRGQARVEAVVAEGPRKPDLRSRSSHRARSERRQSWRRPRRKACRASGVIRPARPGAARWRSGCRTARGCASKRASTARRCISCFRR